MKTLEELNGRLIPPKFHTLLSGIELVYIGYDKILILYKDDDFSIIRAVCDVDGCGEFDFSPEIDYDGLLLLTDTGIISEETRETLYEEMRRDRLEAYERSERETYKRLKAKYERKKEE